MSPPLLLALHLSDGVLSPVWVWLGFGGMILLMVPAMRRVSDEEIPKIALLTAAFFIASSLHVKLGPTSVHLLFNGLVGVVLGSRAALAIPVGLLLQAFLLGHGGLSMLGINSCILTLPALLCSEIVIACRRPLSGFRADLVWLLAALLPIMLINQLLLSGLLLVVDSWALQRPPYFDLVWRLILLIPAIVLGVLIQPLLLRLFFRVRRLADFFLGCLIGAVGVAVTLFLHAVVLLYGGSADWTVLVTIIIPSHLPVLILESLIMGFTVQFLGRVKPAYLVGPYPDSTAKWQQPLPVSPSRPTTAATTTDLSSAKTLALLLALGGLLLTTNAAQAHRLDGQYFFTKDGQIRIEAYYDNGTLPETGQVQVYLPDNQLLTEGKILPKGLFFFRVKEPVTLRVVINPGDGHRKELTIPGTEIHHRLQPKDHDSSENTSPAVAFDPGELSPHHKEPEAFPLKDVLIGIGFLLAVASFFLSWRNYQTLKKIKQHVGLLDQNPNKETGCDAAGSP